MEQVCITSKLVNIVTTL